MATWTEVAEKRRARVAQREEPGFMEVSQSDAHILKMKAVTSLKCAFNAFNSSVDDGRDTNVLLHLQHSFEMLLKAALNRRKVSIVVKASGKTKSMQLCLNLAQEHLHLTKDEIGTLRTVELFRDGEQHFHTEVSESLLHIHAQAAIGIFEKLLLDRFQERLADVLLLRVLPLSTLPLESFQTLIDSEYSQIERMLQKGRRQTTEARAKLRTLMAMAAHVEGEFFEVSENDVASAMRNIKRGGARQDVLPGLSSIATNTVGSVDQRIVVKFMRTDPNAIPFRPAEEGEEAYALKEVDLHSTFKLNRSMLASRCGLTTPKALALRNKLNIESDPKAYRKWIHADRPVEGYSEVAVNLMKGGMGQFNMDEVWEEHRIRVKNCK